MGFSFFFLERGVWISKQSRNFASCFFAHPKKLNLCVAANKIEKKKRVFSKNNITDTKQARQAKNKQHTKYTHTQKKYKHIYKILIKQNLYALSFSSESSPNLFEIF